MELEAYLLYLFFPLLLLLLLLHLATSSTKKICPGKQLPSPPKLPIIGHLHLIGALPHVSFYNLAKKHGPDLMLLHLGTVPNLVVSSPRAAEAILRTHDHIFAHRARSTVAGIIFYGPTDIAFSPYNEEWRQRRKIATTHLLSVKKVQSYRPARQDEVGLVMAKIREAVATSTAVDMTELLNAYANGVVCHAVAGTFFRRDGRNKLFRELMEANSLLLAGFNIEDHFPSLARVDVVVYAKAKKLKKWWDQLLDGLIDDHATKLIHHNDNDEEESDFVDVLLSVREEYGLTRERIKAMLMNVFQGGIDTTFVVADFAMAELMRNPRLMTKLQDEVRKNTRKDQEMVTEDDLSNMTYLKAVVKETIRLHPPGPLLIPHLSMVDCDIDGYTIPSGTRVIVNAWAIGRDDSSWEASEEFVPERFIDRGGTANVDFTRTNFAFIPFGSGRRMCPGANFAIATIEMMLANLAYHFNWDLPEKSNTVDMTEKFGLTLRRKEKLLLVPKMHQ